MSRFAVDAAQVQSASAAVAASITTVSGEVAAMTRHLTDLQGSWQGQASTAFQQIVTSWRATQERVQEELQQIGAALTSAGRAYDEAETGAVRLFSS